MSSSTILINIVTKDNHGHDQNASTSFIKHSQGDPTYNPCLRLNEGLNGLRLGHTPGAVLERD